MNQTVIYAIIAVIAFLIFSKLVLWRLLKRQFGPQSDSALTRSTPAPSEQNGVVSSAASALEDVAGPFVGVDAHPDLAGPPDDLTRIKGLGPKAAAQLKLLGITRYAQLAAIDSAQAASLDEQMGVFRGRFERDRWIEQARYLARGDTKSFEAEFGTLG